MKRAVAAPTLAATIVSILWIATPPLHAGARDTPTTLPAHPLLLAIPASAGEAGGPPFVVAKTAPVIDFYLFHGLPDEPKGTLWSSWGDGCLASNGKYYLGIGNHLDLAAGRGESRVYEYDPSTRRVRLVVNVRDLIPDPNYSGGKIHSCIEEARDGWLYFSLYCGKVPKESDWQGGYQGGALLRYDPRSGRAESLGLPVPKQDLPASRLDPIRGLLYFYAVPSGDLVVYDLAKRHVKFRGGGDRQVGDRNILLDRDGNAYFSAKDGFLWRYNPRQNRLAPTKARLPQAHNPPDGGPAPNSLRASTRPARNGLVYGMTRTGILFAFDPARERVTNLGPNFGKGEYTAVMVLSPDERYLYYAPGSHGQAARIGCPVVQYEIATGTRKVLAFLNPFLRERFQYNLGGTFNMQIAPDGGTLFLTFNGAPWVGEAQREETFGLPSLVVLHIPVSER